METDSNNLMEIGGWIVAGIAGIWQFISYLLKRKVEKTKIQNEDNSGFIENVQATVEILLKVQENLRFSLEKAEGQLKEYQIKFLDLSQELGSMIERIGELKIQISIRDAEITKLKSLVMGINSVKTETMLDSVAPVKSVVPVTPIAKVSAELAEVSAEISNSIAEVSATLNGKKNDEKSLSKV